MKTIAYVDGYNLYHRLLKKDRDTRWLDLEALIQNALSPKAELIQINYYTARVTAGIDLDAPRKQKLYWNALLSNPKIKKTEGKFLIKPRWAGLVHPPEFLPNKEMIEPYPDVVRVRKAEEKGSDVNLATHLVRDAFTQKFDQAVVITNDTDLIEPIRVVTEELGLKVGLLAPVDKPAHFLKAVASWVYHLKPIHARNAQLPMDVKYTHRGKDKIASCPPEWR